MTRGSAEGGPVTPRERLAYLGYRAAAVAARWLPDPLVGVVAAVAGTVAAHLLRARRRVVARTLARVGGGRLRGRVLRRAVGATFRSYARYWIETLRLPHLGIEELDRRVRIDGLDHLDAALAAGRGVVLVTAHLGGWDVGGAWLAGHGYPVTTVVEALRPPALFEWFAALRRRLGLEVVRHDAGTLDALRAALERGRIVALICDRDLGRRGVPVTFFGEETTLPAGPARLALETGAALLAGAVYHRPRGAHLGVLRPPLPLPTTGDLRADVARLTQAIAADLEVLIRAEPTQWHLMQPNWPADAPGRSRSHRA